MRAYLAICVVCFLAMVVPHTAAGEGKLMEPVQAQKSIHDINRLKPLQNPRHEQSSKVLNRHVLDRGGKVIGAVDDVLIGDNGKVLSLRVRFDQLRLSQPVFLNYETFGVGNVIDGYRLEFDAQEIEDIYPALLSSMDVAAGEKATQRSTKDLIGSKVVTSAGVHIGTLDDVLFDQGGSYIRNMYMAINYQAIHEKGIAVPLSVLQFEQKDGHTHIVVDQKYADMIVQYAKDS